MRRRKKWNIVNRKRKDTLFCLIFGRQQNRQWTLSLYNAVNGSDYQDPDVIEFNTLEEALFMGVKNDVSFILDSVMSLYEHQSTFNPNMPLRGFLYHSRLYQGYISPTELRKQMHTSKQVRIPTPRYIVFYNGDADMPPIVKLKLSDAFIHPDDSGEFEWTATMYNLNVGKNDELLARCKPLADYMTLIGYVRTNKMQSYGNDEAINMAIDRCIDEGILEEFLVKHRAEVLDMLLTEYDEEVIKAGFIEEGYDRGLAEGREEGLAEGREEGLAEGREEGRTSEIFSSVAEGDYSAARGAEKLGLSEDEFLAKMKTAGYTAPAK